MAHKTKLNQEIKKVGKEKVEREIKVSGTAAMLDK